MKIDAIINSQKHEEAVAAEKIHFSKTDRLINPKKVSPYKHWVGNKAVLVTAPHSVRHVRKKKIKPSDIFTGSLAYLLSDNSGCHSLALVKAYNGDPNFDKASLFKDEIKRICGKYDIKLIIDLHGASRERSFDVDIGTMKGKSLLGRKELKDSLFHSLHESGLKRITTNNFPGSSQDTIIKYSAVELKIPAMQLEINRRLRAPNQNGDPFNRLLAGLVFFISELGD